MIPAERGALVTLCLEAAGVLALAQHLM